MVAPISSLLSPFARARSKTKLMAVLIWTALLYVSAFQPLASGFYQLLLRVLSSIPEALFIKLNQPIWHFAVLLTWTFIMDILLTISNRLVALGLNEEHAKIVLKLYDAALSFILSIAIADIILDTVKVTFRLCFTYQTSFILIAPIFFLTAVQCHRGSLSRPEKDTSDCPLVLGLGDIVLAIYQRLTIQSPLRVQHRASSNGILGVVVFSYFITALVGQNLTLHVLPYLVNNGDNYIRCQMVSRQIHLCNVQIMHEVFENQSISKWHEIYRGVLLQVVKWSIRLFARVNSTHSTETWCDAWRDYNTTTASCCMFEYGFDSPHASALASCLFLHLVLDGGIRALCYWKCLLTMYRCVKHWCKETSCQLWLFGIQHLQALPLYSKPSWMSQLNVKDKSKAVLAALEQCFRTLNPRKSVSTGNSTTLDQAAIEPDTGNSAYAEVDGWDEQGVSWSDSNVAGE